MTLPADYAARLGVARRDGESPQAWLARLHRAHVETLPFNNVDLLLGQLPQLDAASRFAKVLERRRGGYCFELNACFADLLVAQGFEVRSGMARVLVGGGTPQTRQRSHHLLFVRLDGVEWLADVGFGGGGLVEPVPLRAGEFDQGQVCLRLQPDGDAWRLQRRRDDDWSDLYHFDLQPAYPIDFDVANFYIARSPQSLFTNLLLVTRYVAAGQLALAALRFTRVEDGIETTEVLADPSRLRQVLADAFGLAIDAAEASRLFAFAASRPSPF
ncbi:arylamine N-acetyltransferase family protein [Jeongeupia chitinilytica]|uniref:N-hydroxyarylamine O-acetyltransferase n=1 Tax=Jeongeupia chitinilytica TaxID=1041641 RepID=A0ABQ3H0N4_9NEIS|nr:arylamine N-acetyltransferase [Jeongeupia chitinilytica]GHD61579.1 N-hydroxyarylamine O-acetyltransferase [Jeongeupia chitinilytica]